MRIRLSLTLMAASLAIVPATRGEAQTNGPQLRTALEQLTPATRTELPSRFVVTSFQEALPPERRRDSPWDGLLIGAVIGAAIGFSTYTDCTPVPPEALCGGNLTTSRGMETAAAAALFGALGLSLDVMLDRRSDARPSSAPARPGFSVALSRAGVQAQFGKRF